MIKDHIIFKNKLYTVTNIHNIGVDTKNVSEKTDKATIAFESRYGPFSNLYPANIEIEGTTYPST